MVDWANRTTEFRASHRDDIVASLSVEERGCCVQRLHGLYGARLRVPVDVGAVRDARAVVGRMAVGVTRKNLPHVLVRCKRR